MHETRMADETDPAPKTTPESYFSLTALPYPQVSDLCLAVPGKLEEKQGRYGIVDFAGMRRKVDISLLPDCEIGDYVIVHAGFAIETLDEDDALVTLDIFKQIEAAME